MRIAQGIALLPLLAVAIGCAGQRPTDDGAGEWVGTVTTEGNVTTVVNQAGSVWGGSATLVEEASIGVEAGATEYMLGSVGGVYATDEHIVVVDRQVPAVRVYDLDGNHIRDLGQEGQGPGEYTYPSLVVGDAAGRVFVQESRADLFNVFSIDGEVLGTWPARNASCCAYPMVATPRNTLWARTLVRDEETREARYGLQEYGPDGPVGELRYPDEFDFEPVEFDVTLRGRTFTTTAPFSPRSIWVTAPSGALVTGASDRYRLEVQTADGAVLAIEKYWTPVPVEAEEAEWTRRYYVAGFRMEGGDDFNWDGAEMPATKPAFSSFVPVPSGDVWVSREGPGERLSDCAEDPVEDGMQAAAEAPCWRSSRLLDVFDSEGRFLGEVETPRGMLVSPSYLRVRGDKVVGVVEDDDGVIMVKRWRLVLPRR